MAWLRLAFNCQPDCVDDLKDLLDKFDAGSVSIAPASGEPLFADGNDTGQYWEETTVSGLFRDDMDLDILIACVRNRLGDNNIKGTRVEPVADKDWVDGYRSGVKPLIFSNHLCICPGWCTPPEGIDYVVELDPGLAFGTGSHPTTAMCLRWLARQALGGRAVIDYGCGSGILALAAACLGAARVLAVDIDPQALDAAAENARKNGLEEKVDVFPPDHLQGIGADILVANILLNPLLGLAGRFSELLPEGGTLVLSGLLANQAEECMAAYQYWFRFSTPVYDGEWAMLTATRNEQRRVSK